MYVLKRFSIPAILAAAFCWSSASAQTLVEIQVVRRLGKFKHISRIKQTCFLQAAPAQMVNWFFHLQRSKRIRIDFRL